MKLLETYRAPGEDELKKFSLAEAETLDALNKEIHLRNRLLVHNARAILQEVDPASKLLREIEAPAPPLVYARVVQLLGQRGVAGATAFAAASGKKPAP